MLSSTTSFCSDATHAPACVVNSTEVSDVRLLPARSATLFLTVSMYEVEGDNGSYGWKEATLSLYVTAPGICSVFLYKRSVSVEIVSGFISSEKTTVNVASHATDIAPSGGSVEVISGGMMSIKAAEKSTPVTPDSGVSRAILTVLLAGMKVYPSEAGVIS